MCTWAETAAELAARENPVEGIEIQNEWAKVFDYTPTTLEQYFDTYEAVDVSIALDAIAFGTK